LSGIVVANEYTSVHSKAWIVPKKKQALGKKRMLKGPVKVKSNTGSITYDSPDDMLKAMQQESKAAEVRYPDQESFENAQQQTGKALWSYMLVRQVTKLNPNLFAEDSLLVPGCAAFYTVRDQKKVPTGASFRKGLIPEHTIFKKNPEFDSVNITYGWRTVIMRLVKAGYLTYSQMVKTWGEVEYTDARGKHWNANIREFRA
jgi:hypothetical protein